MTRVVKPSKYGRVQLWVYDPTKPFWQETQYRTVQWSSGGGVDVYHVIRRYPPFTVAYKIRVRRKKLR